MFSLRSKLFGAAAGLAMAAGFAASANATLISFDFNVANEAYSTDIGNFTTTLSNITQLGFIQSGPTTIVLNSTTGAFTDIGTLKINSFVTGGNGEATINSPLLTIQYNLTGIDNGSTLTFTNGGSVTLFAGNTAVAHFSVKQPSGSTGGSVSLNGVVSTLSLGLTLQQLDDPSLITVAGSGIGGQSLKDFALEFVTAQPQFDSSKGGSITPGQDCPEDLGGTAGGCVEFLTSALPGTIEIEVPEPAILGVFGVGLLGLAGLRCRKAA